MASKPKPEEQVGIGHIRSSVCMGENSMPREQCKYPEVTAWRLPRVWKPFGMAADWSAVGGP